MNVYYIKKIFLSIVLFLIIAGYWGCKTSRRGENDLGMDPRFYSVLSQILQEDFIHKTPLVGDSLYQYKNFFVLKFFNIETCLYFSLWLQPSFPEINRTDDGSVWTDTNNIYYYSINGNSLVILDCISSQGYGLYQKNTNKQAIEVMQRAREFYTPMLVQINPSPITYFVKKNGSIVRVSPILPKRHENEKWIEDGNVPYGRFPHAQKSYYIYFSKLQSAKLTKRAGYPARFCIFAFGI